MLVSVAIPCYNSEATIRKVVEMVMAEFEKRPEYSCEFVLVNDNSRDGTFEEIRKLCRMYKNVRGINLMRNFGQHNALMAAMNYVNGDLVLGMDDDMQTHPSQIFKLLYKISEGYDLVYGIYEKRKNSALKNATSKVNEVTSRLLLGRPRQIHSSNFWVITRAVAEQVVKYPGYNPYIDGIFYRITHNIGNVVVEHHKREVGSSNYTMKKLIKLWMAYWNYSVIPLRISSVLGGIFACVGFVLAIVTVLQKLIFAPDMPMGWPSLFCAILIFSGIVLLVLGIIGEYLGKILLTLNHTPQYIIRETVNIGQESGENAGKTAGTSDGRKQI